MSKLLTTKVLFCLILVLFGEICMAIPIVPFPLLKTTETISSFESYLGKKLPPDYKDFIIEYNGGEPQQPNNLEGNSNVSVRYFLGFQDKSIYDLRYILDSYKDVTPLNTIPIGEDDSGNLILLNLNKLSYGNIIFWDHENNNLTTIAQSFTTLINSLVVLTSEDVGLKNEDIISSWINPIFLKNHSDK